MTTNTFTDARGRWILDGTEVSPNLLRELIRGTKALADAPHVLQINQAGWGLEHTLRCRPAGLYNCEVNRAAERLLEPPAEVGSRVAVHVGPDGDLVVDGPAPVDPAPELLNILRLLEPEGPRG